MEVGERCKEIPPFSQRIWMQAVTSWLQAIKNWMRQAKHQSMRYSPPQRLPGRYHKIQRIRKPLVVPEQNDQAAVHVLPHLFRYARGGLGQGPHFVNAGGDVVDFREVD